MKPTTTEMLADITAIIASSAMMVFGVIRVIGCESWLQLASGAVLIVTGTLWTGGRK